MTAPVTRPYLTLGRPVGSGATQAIIHAFGADRILAMIADGETLQNIASAIPCGYGSLHEFLALPALSDRYARAREAKADIYADKALQVALQSSSDTYIDDKGRERTNNDVIQRSRLQSEVYRWHAKCLSPSKYGERVAVDQTVTLSPLADAFARITAGGSSIPISSAYQAARVQDVVDVIPVELEPCCMCGDDGIDGAGCPLCGVIQV